MSNSKKGDIQPHGRGIATIISNKIIIYIAMYYKIKAVHKEINVGKYLLLVEK